MNKLEKNMDFIITGGFDAVVLYFAINLFNKIKDKTETIPELDYLRKILYIVLGFNIFLIIAEIIYLVKSKKKIIYLFILTLSDLILTVTFIIILQKLEDFYKAKNYDKSTQYAKILIGIDACSILTSFASVLINRRKN